MKLRLWLLGAAAGTLPTLLCAYRRVTRPTGAVALPTSDTSLSLVTALSIGTDEYREFDTGWITGVEESDAVFFTLEREAADGYDAEIGLLDVVAVLAPGA